MGEYSVRCNACGHVGAESEFPKGRDFFQHSFIASCPKCSNHDSPGNASMRMFPNASRPFEYVYEAASATSALTESRGEK